MRALIEMTKHLSFTIDRLLTISVDCLGTFPADEYKWRLERIERSNPDQGINVTKSSDELASEALKFARQGGIVPYRYRSACQVCISPEAIHADINIQILGLPVRQQILVVLNDPAIASHFNILPLSDSEADSDLILQHERIVSKKIEQYQRTLERTNEGMGELLPENVDALIHQLESCGDCQTCMDVCPICSVDWPTRYSDGHYERSDVVRWLVSCAGCGMCEQACPSHLPLSAIFAHIRHQLDQEWEYFPGCSFDDPLPMI
jgi:Pyruvate/2-oxoacid:ferredoxin oxidoreductase delta subunit